MTLKETLQALGRVVLEEAERNSAFAKRLEQALARAAPMERSEQDQGASQSKRSRGRPPAVLDPIAKLASEGEEKLRDELRSLSLDKLLDIVADFGMDPSKLVMKWKSPDRIIEHIVENAKRRSIKGDAFRA